jgi:hypothetical protein
MRIASFVRKLSAFLEIQGVGRRRHGFWTTCILTLMIDMASAWCTLLEFHERCFIFAESVDIFQNSRWRRPPSWMLGKIIFDQSDG